MAKWYGCQTLIVCCLFLYFGISTVTGQSELDHYEFEDSYDGASQLAYIKLLEKNGPHKISKRDTSNSTKYDSNTTLPTSVPEKSTTQFPKKVVSVAVQKTVDNVSLLEHPLTRNLGENGTGIRRNITTSTTSTTTIVPTPSRSEPNVTIVKTNTINKSTTNSSQQDIDEDVYDDFKLPSDLDTVEGSKKFNESLSKHNLTSSKTDPNLFYNTSIYSDPNIGHFYWMNLSDKAHGDVIVNELLSNSHRRAATVKLSFHFPFYGHLIKNVTIATGGFLYTGDYVHTWLAATQYIAPLMANFDTSLSNNSFIKYFDNGTAFTVEWERVNLQDKPEDGEFTFQVTLMDNGDIIFVYKDIPLLVDQIQELHHPVKVGLSDAYIMDQTVFLVRRKTIYEYDRVNFNKTHIKDWTTIVLKALPTCLDARDCNSCLSRKLNYECFWCPAMNKCSQGYDRHRQNWLAHDCDTTSFKNVSLCSSSYSQSTNAYIFNHNTASNDPDKMALAGKVIVTGSQKEVGMSGILAILFLIGMVSGLTFWVFYAYRNPHTTSGQILIRYRPSQWGWRRGEARYTAATIHM